MDLTWKSGVELLADFISQTCVFLRLNTFISAASEDAVEKWRQRMEEAELIMKEMERRLEEEEQQNKLLQAGLPTRWKKKTRTNCP